MANVPFKEQDKNQDQTAALPGISGWLGSGSSSTPSLPGSGAPEGGSTSSGGVSGTAPGVPTAPMSAPGSGTGWVNMQDYGAANKGTGSGLADKLTSNAGDLDQYTTDVTKTMRSQQEQQALDKAKSDATAAGQDPGSVWLNLSGQAAPAAPVAPKDWGSLSDTEQHTAGADTAYNQQIDAYNTQLPAYQQELASWEAGNTQAPEAASSRTPAEAATYQAQVDANTNPAGIPAAFDTLFGGQQGYTPGAGALDSFLVQNDPGAAQKLADYRSKYTGILGQIQSGTLPVGTVPQTISIGAGPEEKKRRPIYDYHSTPYTPSTGYGGGGGTSSGV
jgi:hypothetical protein